MVHTLPLIVAVISIGVASPTDWPLRKCSRNDPHIDNCILEAAKVSARTVINGLPSLRLPPLEPVALGDRMLSVHKGPVNLDVDFKNAVLMGVPNLRFDSAKYNKGDHRLELHAFHNKITLSAKYSMKGRLFVVPINNAGTVEITFNNVYADHIFQFKPRRQLNLDTQPKQIPEVQCFLKMTTLDQMHLNLSSTSVGSYGNRALNELMNSNWKILFNSFRPSIENWLQEILTKMLNPLFRSFTFEQMFPHH